MLEFVKAFHIKYKIPIENDPKTVKMDRINLRLTLLKEEIAELVEADELGIITEIAKESGDVLYALLGTALELGYHSDFENINLFRTDWAQNNAPTALIQIEKAQAAFRNDWSKDNLKTLFWEIGSYLNAVGLKDVYPRIFQEVHRSNMSKGTNGQPIIRTDGKIMKGTDFQLADMSFLN